MKGRRKIPAMHTRYSADTQSLVDAVLNSPGYTTPELRRSVATHVAQLCSRSSQDTQLLPQELERYVTRVALYAYRTTDEDIEELRKAGYSDDALFEITLSAALAAGMARLECGLAVLKGARDAHQEA